MPLVRALANKVIAGFLVVMGLAMIILAVTLWQQRQASLEFTRCTAQWQADFLASYNARAEAASQVSNAVDDVIHSVAQKDPHGFHHALRNYERVRTQQNHQRLTHPPPPPPSVVCGS